MAEAPAYVLQKAVIAALRADPEIQALVGAKVFDEPPPPAFAEYPYIHLGRIDAAAERIGCYTDDDIFFTVECQSRPVAGRDEVTQLAHAVRLGLDQVELTLPGLTLDWCDYLTQSVSRSRDGGTWTAVVAFSASVAAAV
ncbi:MULTISPECIES: DUF3168 domain-containing protein [Salipiger]|uniref:Putative DUF3168 protein n=1 Tax=Salipiger profundus TaxID=1229727 RepID=A0A1U7D506_9RHOB|nr:MULTISPECIES: DUF3168 domain-containing protein [Salipiger]APX23193.1 putative DUF3168 protein [Salipiger profundus]GGA13967.1 hypothetical protein GCM10011326_27600 [Salipiger profundus]SFD16154.1 Protein of unknown function [Salipiger profundus]